MDDLSLDYIRDTIEAPIDFQGQRLAEQLSTNILAVVTTIAFIVGYFTQNIHFTLWTGLAGTLLTFVAVVPPWPFFNKHNPKWLPARASAVPAAGVQIHFDGTSASVQ